VGAKAEAKVTVRKAYMMALTTDAKLALRFIIERINWECGLLDRTVAAAPDFNAWTAQYDSDIGFFEELLHQEGFTEGLCMLLPAICLANTSVIANPTLLLQDITAIANTGNVKNTKMHSFMCALILEFTKTVIIKAVAQLWGKKAQSVNGAAIKGMLMEGKLCGELGEDKIFDELDQYITIFTPIRVPKAKKDDEKKVPTNVAPQLK
jgi:hypothetical protein